MRASKGVFKEDIYNLEPISELIIEIREICNNVNKYCRRQKANPKLWEESKVIKELNSLFPKWIGYIIRWKLPKL